MPDKLTDNEIKKALECCSTYHDVSSCQNCPLDGKCEPNRLEQYALDLINRQQEAIETLRGCIERHHIIRKDGKSPLSLLTAEIKAEAYKEYHKKFEKNIKDVKVTLGQTWEIQNAIKKTLNELVGDKDGKDV